MQSGARMHHRLSIVPYVLLSEYASEIGHGGWGLMRILETVRPIEDAKMAARPVMQQWPIVVDRWIGSPAMYHTKSDILSLVNQEKSLNYPLKLTVGFGWYSLSNLWSTWVPKNCQDICNTHSWPNHSWRDGFGTLV